MEQAILFDWCTRSVASQYCSRVVSVSLVSRLCPKCLKMLQKPKSYRKLYSQIMCLSSIGTKRCLEYLCVYIYIHVHSLCFSLNICIKFDPFLQLTPLGATSISSLPQLQPSKRKHSLLLIYIPWLSERLQVLFTLVDIRPNSPEKVSLSFQLASTWEENEAIVIALEGMLCIFPEVSPSSALCSLQGRLWLTVLLAPSVHLWCTAAAVRKSVHAATDPS